MHRSVPVGAELELRIAFRRPVRSFKHEGHVVWVREESFRGHPFALGVHLTKLQEGTAEAWERMLERKIGDSPPFPIP